MVNIDLKRAKNLLNSARILFEEGDIYGVSGLAYQAFESATIALLREVNGYEQTTHFSRRRRAKDLLKKYREKIDFIWEARNIDFYGNIRVGKKKREITEREAKDSLFLIENMIKEIEDLLKEKDQEY